MEGLRIAIAVVVILLVAVLLAVYLSSRSQIYVSNLVLWQYGKPLSPVNNSKESRIEFAKAVAAQQPPVRIVDGLPDISGVWTLRSDNPTSLGKAVYVMVPDGTGTSRHQR